MVSIERWAMFFLLLQLPLWAADLSPRKRTLFESGKGGSAESLFRQTQDIAVKDSGANGIVIRTAKGAKSPSFTLRPQLTRAWHRYDFLELEIESGDNAPRSINLSLSDTYSHGYYSRADIAGKAIQKGRQTVTYRINPARRMGIDPIRRWLPDNQLELGDAVQLHDLKEVRLSWKASGDGDSAFTLRRMTLVRVKPRVLWPDAPRHHVWSKMGMESDEEILALRSEVEQTTIERVGDKGVTEGKHAARIVAPKGQPWCSFTLGRKAIKDWSDYDYLALDVFIEDDHSYRLNFELWDGHSYDLDTRSTQSVKLHAGQQTLLYRIKGAEPNRTRGMTMEHGLPWKTARPEKIDLSKLKKVKFYLTPRKDRDAVFWIDNVRLVRASRVEVLYEVDFEKSNYLQGQGTYYGRWVSNQGLETLSVKAPKGEKNRSKQALTYTVGTKNSSGVYSLETTSLRDVYMELAGWDGGFSFKVYNGGFERFYAIYLPTVPVDTTFFRAYFEVPKGEWREFTIPLDDFRCHGLRPRRGAEVERLVFAGLKPDGEESFFQIDDVQAYRVQRNRERPAPKKPNPAGVLYQQDFNDPLDFDVNTYNTESFHGDVLWSKGSWNPETGKEERGGGCLKVVYYKDKGPGIMGGRRIRIRDGDVVEFDLKAVSMRTCVFKARGAKRYQSVPLELPEGGGWKRYRMTVDGVSPGRNRFIRSGIYFTGNRARDGKEAYMLVDNIVIRRPGAERD